METSEKVRENRLRRMAKRQGYYLEKSRRRDTKAIDYGGYMLIDERSDTVVFGTQGGYSYQATLDEVEDFLNGKYDADGSLLERARNHKTADEGRDILIETINASKEGRISAKEAYEISSIISSKRKDDIDAKLKETASKQDK